VRRTLGGFELLSELGRGGMGIVYRAWQPSLGRQVPLKKLLPSGDARTEARFRREIRSLERVEHPHLVKVFTSGFGLDGRPALHKGGCARLAMKYDERGNTTEPAPWTIPIGARCVRRVRGEVKP
jgi:serine/threonine protein kinase